ncbi:MAG: guanylate kinase [Flavobacteriia bacterium 40-80]|nr:MAG: guanylate kinase [Flavobacteriia bacterium 40-80]
MPAAIKKGKCVIFSAPSGAGKTTIVRALLEQIDLLEFSVSACSRQPRPNEKNGVDYYFLSAEEFRKKIDNDEFLEWEEVYKDHFYGTLKSEVERIWKDGKAVIFDVDVVGGINLKNKLGEQALAIFVAPPAIETLEERLRIRSTETEDKIRIRTEKARYEMSFAEKFDVVLVNELLEKSIAEAKEITERFIQS